MRYTLRQKETVLEAVPLLKKDALSAGSISFKTDFLLSSLQVSALIRKHFVPYKVIRFKREGNVNFYYYRTPVLDR